MFSSSTPTNPGTGLFGGQQKPGLLILLLLQQVLKINPYLDNQIQEELDFRATSIEFIIWTKEIKLVSIKIIQASLFLICNHLFPTATIQMSFIVWPKKESGKVLYQFPKLHLLCRYPNILPIRCQHFHSHLIIFSRLFIMVTIPCL